MVLIIVILLALNNFRFIQFDFDIITHKRGAKSDRMMKPSNFPYIIATIIISANYISNIFAADFQLKQGNNTDGTNKTRVTRKRRGYGPRRGQRTISAVNCQYEWGWGEWDGMMKGKNERIIRTDFFIRTRIGYWVGKEW